MVVCGEVESRNISLDLCLPCYYTLEKSSQLSIPPNLPRHSSTTRSHNPSSPTSATPATAAYASPASAPCSNLPSPAGSKLALAPAPVWHVWPACGTSCISFSNCLDHTPPSRKRPCPRPGMARRHEWSSGRSSLVARSAKINLKRKRKGKERTMDQAEFAHLDFALDLVKSFWVLVC